MGVPDVIEKVRCWIITRGATELRPRNVCRECDTLVSGNGVGDVDENVKMCKFCCVVGSRREGGGGRKCSEKVHPSVSPPSPCFSNETIKCSADDDESSAVKDHLSKYLESQFDCSSGMYYTSNRAYSVQQRHDGISVTQNKAVINRPGTRTEDPDTTDDFSDDLSAFRSQYQKPLDFENNGLIWYPPPPDDEAESNFFSYDDEDDDIGDSGAMFSSSSSLSSMFPAKDKQNEGNKEPLRAVVQGYFRALVSQLLQGEGGDEDWLDIVTSIAWQAANFVKPDTSRGDSMDPGDYVKIKCIPSRRPSESTLVKGVVCTKNIRHKRMTSQYKNPRLLILGGALEYQKVPNQLASFNTLLHQENDHLRMVISKIEALRPNVLLVEKSVSSYAQEHLLEKEISLVLNVKRPVLERIARCTGALITPSIDDIPKARLGHCELFRLEKISEHHEPANQFNKKPVKTLMFFEGCPRRLSCTVLLKGACVEQLKKIKHVVQYAVFAAYHLSLETSFLVDEGATLPKMTPRHSISDNSLTWSNSKVVPDAYTPDDDILALILETERSESLSEHPVPDHSFPLSNGSVDFEVANAFSDPYYDDLVSQMFPDTSSNQCNEITALIAQSAATRCISQLDSQETLPHVESLHEDIHELTSSEKIEQNEPSSEYFSTADTHQSILVSFSSHCILKGTVCERSRLLRIKFYGCFDKPLGRYLRDDLFDQTSFCRSCKDPAEAHVSCYTHQQGNLTINVKRLPSLKLPGERDGKIWMWHRCLRCAHIDGVPPATRRVVMSDAAWGLSFGKFLELSFSNHATANRVATCGHSLQRDCLRYYGFGSMVAFFRYSPIDILSVQLPPPVLEFNGQVQPDWIRKEATELMGKMETLYAEISDVLGYMEEKNRSFGCDVSGADGLQNHIMELKDQLKKERNDYIGFLQPAFVETSEPEQMATVDVLELNRLRRSLLIGSHDWDRQLYLLDSLIQKNPVPTGYLQDLSTDASCKDDRLDLTHEGNIVSESPKILVPSVNNLLLDEEPSVSFEHSEEDMHSDSDVVYETSYESLRSQNSTLSEIIDSAWTGTDQHLVKARSLHASQADEPAAVILMRRYDDPPFRKLKSPMRVHSFDSAVRFQERIRKGLPPSSLHLSTLRSFHASGDYRSMVRDPLSAVTSTYSQALPSDSQKLNVLGSTPSFVSSASQIADGVRLLLSQTTNNDVVVGVYDSEPTSIISYALSCKDYEDWVGDKSNEHDGVWSMHGSLREDSAAPTFSPWPSFGSLDLEYMNHGTYGSEDASSSMSNLFAGSKKSPHLRISFGDESSNAGDKVKFSVTCYFAKQFDSLRKICCPNEVDFVRSLSRCQRWSAQGGKSNVYFAKSLDDRFIIKQVTKTELVSLQEFAPEYFKYMTDSLGSGSPTCLAKILGIYQVTVKHLKGGKETKMDLMVMENLLFKRNISRVYDLKGSSRSRYNSDTTGANKVLLDMNLLESLRTKPMFLGSKAKRTLERSIWNDTNFLASVDVMDYSLLVGVDDERKELVLGIIDYMRQYTWDKHLETWVKASGILGGPKNASPTIISPKQYKKRFRKAMTTYFLTVPDQWSS